MTVKCYEKDLITGELDSFIYYDVKSIKLIETDCLGSNMYRLTDCKGREYIIYADDIEIIK